MEPERVCESNGGQRAACIQFQCQLRVRVRPIKFCCVCAEGSERQLCAADNKLLPSITSSPYCFSHFLCSSTYRAHLPCFNGLPDVLLLCSISAAKAAAAAAHQMNAYKTKQQKQQQQLKQGQRPHCLNRLRFVAMDDYVPTPVLCSGPPASSPAVAAWLDKKLLC